jgi:hypothetical protein
MDSFHVRGIKFDWDWINKQYVGILNHPDFVLTATAKISHGWKKFYSEEICLSVNLHTANLADDINIIIYDTFTKNITYNSLLEQALNQLSEDLHKRLERAKTSVLQLTSAIVKTL